jgi:hypothetical protein
MSRVQKIPLWVIRVVLDLGFLRLFMLSLNSFRWLAFLFTRTRVMLRSANRFSKRYGDRE